MNNPNQTVILVDENNNKIGYESKIKAHTGKGKRHRAFETLLIDHKNNVILQKRKHVLFDNLWDFTAISHPLHTEQGDEDYQTASDKSLMREMNIPPTPIIEIGGFNYYAEHGKNCENEYCVVLIGKYDGKFVHNEKEVYETKKMELHKFLDDVKNNPDKYTIWAQYGASEISKNLKIVKNI